MDSYRSYTSSQLTSLSDDDLTQCGAFPQVFGQQSYTEQQQSSICLTQRTSDEFESIIEVHPQRVLNLNETFIDSSTFSSNPNHQWSDLDTYLHILITFYFGFLATILFFDGIIKNAINIFYTTNPTIQFSFIIFSVCFQAFIIWFLTFSWRWWRFKSLYPNEPSHISHLKIAETYFLISLIILSLGFCVYFILSIISFQCEQYLNDLKQQDYFNQLITLIFKLIFWFFGVVSMFLLNRKIICRQKYPRMIYQVKK